MKKVTPFCLLTLFVFLWGCGPTTEPGPEIEPTQPDIVFILIDDIGIISTPPYSNTTDGSGRAWTVEMVKDNPFWEAYGYPAACGNAVGVDTASPGADYAFPNLFQFSQESMVFNQMYATPSCAPSRAQLLTGQYPYQTGIVYPGWSHTNAPASPQDPNGYLSDTIPTYINMLQSMGYHTAFGGKYNQRYGFTEGDEFDSTQADLYNFDVLNQQQHLKIHGFTETFGAVTDSFASGDTMAYSGGLALLGNTVDYYPPFADSAFFPYELHGWAQGFLKERAAEPDTPFYLHYCFGLIHNYDDSEAFPGESAEEIFATKAQLVDSLIQDLLDSLPNPENTVVIIAGDNGTEGYMNGNNPNADFGLGYATDYQGTPLPGGKVSYQSRGSRVPFLIHWPGVLDSNSTYDALVDFADVFPTMYEIGGGTELDTLRNQNGQSFLNLITNGTKGDTSVTARTAVYSQMQSAGFVANDNYLYYIEDVYDSSSSTCWYDISNSPMLDQPATKVDPSDSTELVSYFQSLNISSIVLDDDE